MICVIHIAWLLCKHVLCRICPSIHIARVLYHTIPITIRGEVNSKRGGALKAGVLIVWYSHVVRALGNVGPRKLGSTKPKALG